jgi:hypothetical protein
MATQAAGKKRNSYSVDDKKLVLKIHADNPKWDQAAVAQEFSERTGKHMRRNTVSDIYSKAKSLASTQPAQAGSKRQRSCKYPLIEQCLMEWFRQVRAPSASPSTLHSVQLMRVAPARRFAHEMVSCQIS